ncbi:unnamed protein product [Arabidopsis arenosa]|uniref:F-box/LRR-repeat protein 15/At3g58940/PEG3-like LRR domain-containing protein n=1 Tax=Arabidopsis arenosa TaxID=38785 RepID=A0A8S2AGK6_ARAAE|nr:unnamed protein product [Arabidopsis arenosa]
MKEVGIDPSVLHYTTLIDGLSRTGNLEACKYFLDEMVKVGCRPDVVCYTVMITGYVVSGELEKAKEMFREMTVEGQLPNVFTYNSMIRGLCMVGELREACWLLKGMESRGWRGVFELDLRIKDEGIHFLPPQLYASKTLVNLTLGTKLYLGNLPSYVSLPSLKSLFIDTVFFDYEDLCCVLLAGCPVLEELSVHHHDFPATPHTISSPTVKRLSVDYHSPDDVDSASHMSFDLPKLVYLEVKRLDVTDLIKGIRNVQTLHLSPDSVHVIYSYCRYGLPVFENLVSLSLGSKNNQGWKLLAYLLKQSTKLETLIVKDLNGYTGDVSMPLNKVKVLTSAETASACIFF